MKDFRRALLDAEQDMIDPRAVARARRRVAARLEAASPEEPSWMRRWSPLIATAACVASALVLYAVTAEDEPAVTAVAEPRPVTSPLEAPPRPGFAARPPPVPTVEHRPPPVPSVPVGDDEGTLVALAIGGSCSWSVDDEPKGTSSSIRLTATLGEHVVTCTPPGGPARSMTVHVTDQKPGIASFRLE